MPMILLIALAVGPVAQAPADGPESPVYRVMNPGTLRIFQAPKVPLLLQEPFKRGLKLTDAQEKQQAAILERITSMRQAVQKAADREKAQVEFLKLREEFDGMFLDALTPEQKERLDQIHLQWQGAEAFAQADLPKRLGLAADQSKQVQAIVEEGREAIDRASLVPLPSKNGNVPKTIEDVQELVRSPEFQASKEKARVGIFERRREILERAEQSLTDRQRAAYRQMLGRPFDVEAVTGGILERRGDPDREVAIVAQQLGFNTGQRADPNFDTKVARPAYTGDRHPSVLFDEAHHNFHTTGGRYKVFADLMSSDGYKVTPNLEPFTPSKLAGFEILVIANALGGEGMGHPDAAKSAFTDAECDAIRDWVEAGGSLLLITDHQPFGDSADALAKRLGVDMSKGVAVDPVNNGERGLLFSREKGLIGDHAITRGRDASERVDRVLTFTGQSLKGPAGSVPFLKFSDTAVDRREGDQVSAAGRAQGIAFARGKGRVVVMGEAAQLSAQVVGQPPIPMGMNAPNCDNRRMALNTMHWLSKLID